MRPDVYAHVHVGTQAHSNGHTPQAHEWKTPQRRISSDEQILPNRGVGSQPRFAFFGKCLTTTTGNRQLTAWSVPLCQYNELIRQTVGTPICIHQPPHAFVQGYHEDKKENLVTSLIMQLLLYVNWHGHTLLLTSVPVNQIRKTRAQLFNGYYW